jgi:uncharacterized protein (TIRG00374 family)
MENNQKKSSPLRLFLGVFISVISLGVLIWWVDGKQVLTSLNQINPIVVFPVLLLLIISLLTRAVAWREILSQRVSTQKSFFIINAGYFVNTLLPFRIGEITRAFLLIPSGFTFWEALPSILLERLFDFGFALILFFTGISFAAGYSLGNLYFFLIAGFVVFGFVVIYTLIRNPDKVISWLEVSTLFSEKIKLRLSIIFQDVIHSLKILRDPKRSLKIFLWMFISWTIALLNQYLLLKSFISDASIICAAFALGALALGVSIPSSPGNIGVYEASLTLAITAFGVDPSIAFAYALSSHVLSLLVTTLLGSFGLFQEGYALGDIWRFEKQDRKEDGI